MTSASPPALDAAVSCATAAPTSTQTLRLDIFTSFEEAEPMAEEWDELVATLDGSLYMTFGWCRVWWRHYGLGRTLRLMAVRDRNELVGIMPFFTEVLGLPFLRTRVAKLVGSDSTVALVEPVLRVDVAADALKLVVEHLFEDDRVDMVHVGPCPGEGASTNAVRRGALRISHIAELVRDRESGSHTAFDMPGGFEAYLASLSRKQRSNYRRNLKLLNNAFTFEADLVSDPARLAVEFEAFVHMHQAQWRAVNKLGHFGDWPGALEFARDLVRTLAQTDQVRLIRLLADDRVIAYNWCFAMGETFYWRLPARVSGEKWRQFALGRVSQMKMMEMAASEGVTAIEAGTGRYEYKELLNAKTSPLRSIVLRRRGLAPCIRTRVTLVCADLLNLVYYRVWYLRLAPRVKVFRNALWRSWIIRRQF